MRPMNGPKNLDSPLYHLLRDDKIADFNAQRPEGQIDLRDANLRGCDLRGANLAGVDLSGAYLRNADLRGLDLRQTRLEHASVAQALLSGCLFPGELSAPEIEMSFQHGTRMRYS